MLRFFYTVCDALAAVCAILSPVAILHWLLKITALPAAVPIVTALDPVFNPMNMMLASLIPTPPLMLNAQPVSTTQALLALGFTLGFFGLHSAAEILKSAEQRSDVRRQTREQQQRLAQIHRQESREQTRLTAIHWRIYAYIRYEASACPSGTALLEQTATRHQAQTLDRTADAITLEFPELESALRTCREMAGALLSHYAALRPADPQPPFTIGLHAVDGSVVSVATALHETARITGFGGRNQIVFSEAIKRLLDARQASAGPSQSLGLYVLNEGRQEEIFRLDPHL
jgi:hypothetical protein